MFSLVHLMDWLNASLLVAPFGIGIVAVMLFVQLRTPDGKSPVLIFLTIATSCGLLFTWIINSGVGLARDWDLLASFFMPMVVLEVYLLSRMADQKQRRYLLAAVVALTILHWGAWIGINASADRHLRRVKMLNSPAILSYSQQIVFDEALANFSFDNGNYRDARTYYEHFISIENTNPRITGNIADVYRKLGEKDKYFAMLKRAVELKSRDPGIYSNLGVEYAGRGDTARAIEFNERAVAIDSNQRLAHANLGILFTNTHRYALAQQHFASAIALGMHEPVIYRYAGDVCVAQNEYPKALEYYKSYLELVPSDKRVRSICEQIQQSTKPQMQ
jgi:tetratricopeptide (TPR) repeat protein